jgi:hypothetical protein
VLIKNAYVYPSQKARGKIARTISCLFFTEIPENVLSFQIIFVSLHLNTAKGTGSDEGRPSFSRLPQAVVTARCDIVE